MRIRPAEKDDAALLFGRGYARLEWSALDWNEPALRFYEEIGAKRMEQWRMLRLEGNDLQRLGEEHEPRTPPVP